jgi:hypothetical protein
LRLPAGLPWWVLCIPALLLAAGLRLGNPGVVAYTGDEAELSLLAMEMAAGQRLPLLGIPSSVGLPNSPLTAWLMAIPYRFTSNPIDATAFVAALNIIGVGLLGWLGWRMGGRELAGAATLFYAVNPWAVHYSRKIWAQNFHTPIILLAFALGILGFIEGKRWAQVFCLPLLLIGVQMHFAALALLPLWLLLLWIGRARLHRAALLMSLTLGAVTLLPYAVGLLNQSPTGVQSGGEVWNSRALLRPAGFMVWLATGSGIEQHIARAVAGDFLRQVPQPGLLVIVPGGLALTGLLMLWRWRSHPISYLLVGWALLVFTVGMVGALPGAFGLPWLDVDAHDFIPVIPALALLSGIGLLAGLHLLRRHRWMVAGVVVGVGLVMVVQAASVRSMQTWVDTHYTPTQFGFSTPLHYLLTVRDHLMAYERVVIARSDDPVIDSASSPAVWRSLLFGTATQADWVGADLPDSFVLVLPPGADVPAVIPPDFALDLIASLPLRPGEGTFQLIQVSSGAS